jgi:signal transduction histidine kinase
LERRTCFCDRGFVNKRVVCNQFEIKVKVKDSGIAQKILDKILQPFFTTKPTGQGTGFGLSLAYDIVKTHGNKIKVKSTNGEGSELVISLPIIICIYYENIFIAYFFLLHFRKSPGSTIVRR